MPRTFLRLFVLPVLVTLGGITQALASPVAAAAQTSLTAGVNPRAQLFGFADPDAIGVRRVGLVSLPVAVRLDLGGGVRASVSTTWARATLERPDLSTVNLSGLTDSTLELGWAAPGGWLTVSAVGVAPTGVTGLSAAQAELAGLTAVNLLAFQTSNWGSGGGVGGGVSLLRSMGAWGLGVSSRYLTSREFEPVEEPRFQYRPGDQWSTRIVVDRRVGTASRASLSASMLVSRDDQVDQANVLRPGNRFQVLHSWAFPVGAAGSGLAYGGYLHRSGAVVLGLDEARSNQGLVLLGAGLRQPSGWGVLVPTSELRLLRREDGVGQGWLISAGMSLERRAGSTTWIPSVTGRLGDVRASEGSSSGFNGIDLGVTVRFGATSP